MRMRVRKGFTLVELLIVIVIIGILASAMMLASGSATASAEATTIIAELRSLRAAALMWYGDHILGDPSAAPTTIADLREYMDSDKIANAANYHFSTADGGWWVGVNVGARVNAVRTRLRDSAVNVGLHGGDGGANAAPRSGDLATGAGFRIGDDTVWMRAR